ncbi:hypothetical protein BSR29_07660 [Boudabousia liubingyangii]|uniref:Uncharacterized protein n=1 Tax=Boudabousia liubingyangii TaxID=1921764 RepID=A0A1Q5PJK5_9ACTO|nr:hypothetical protein [Boudabousia liubingyangii]OKL46123.1 hypothetical protein BSR29_07660 [Boudabousia liubingyangii]
MTEYVYLEELWDMLTEEEQGRIRYTLDEFKKRNFGPDVEDLAVIDLLIEVNAAGIPLPLEYLDWMESSREIPQHKFSYIAENRKLPRG